MKQHFPDQLTLLLLETDSSLTECIRDSSQQYTSNLDVNHHTTGDAGIKHLSDDVDCVVCEYDLVDMDGLAVLEKVREKYPDLPFFLVTDTRSERVAATAIEHDVTSYLHTETVTSAPSEFIARILSHVAERHPALRSHQPDLEYQLVAEVATDVFWQVDLTSGNLRMSDGIAEFGYAPDEIDPDHEWWLERIHPDDRNRLHAEHEAVTTPTPEGFTTFQGTRGQFENEFRWRRADGSFAWVQARGMTLFEDGEAVSQIGTMTDITDRKKRQQELELFDTLLDYAHDAMYVVDADTGNIVNANQTAADQLGYETDTLVGMTVADFSRSHEDSAQWQAETPDLSVGESFSQEDVHVRADGSTFPVEVSVGYAAIENEDYYIAIVRDITQRKEREHELELIERLLEQSNDEVYVADAASGDICMVNQTACDHLHYAQEELIGKSVTSISTHFDSVNEWLNHLDELESRDGLRDETTHVRADGTTYPVEVSVSYVEIDDKAYVITIARDITERKKYEEQLTQQNERLKDFASIVSHDLRNPLAVADGRLDLARQECDSPHLDQVANAHARMESLIEDLLTLARKGDRVQEVTEIAVGEMAETSWEMVDTHGAELKTPTSRVIEADPDRLQELFENLFRNAIDHGGETVTVTVGDLDDGFYVADTGSGIPDEQQNHVFEPGYTTAEDGTGLGLYIVKTIVDAHDWEITVTESEAGGARFEFRDLTSSTE